MKRLCAILAFMLAGVSLAAASEVAPGLLIVRTQAQWQAVIASGQSTPLDALTPHAKKAVVEKMSGAWDERGLHTLPIGELIRQLDREQLRAVLTFLGSEAYLPFAEAQLVGAPLRLAAPSAAVWRDWQRLQSVLTPASASGAESHSTALASSASVDTYLTLFGKRMSEQDLRQQPPGDLLLLFDAAAITDLLNPGSPAFGDLLRVHRELARRGVDTRRTLDDTVLRAMVAAREFAQARSFVANRPLLASKPIPQVVDHLGKAFAGRSIFDYDSAAHTLVRKALPAAGEIELVMVVNANCQPSRRALDALRADPVLRARLQGANMTIIVPPASAIPYGFVADWNAANPALPIRIPFNVREWSSVNTQRVPTFYLLKNGRVAGEVEGWPVEGNRAGLQAMLKQSTPEVMVGTPAQAPEK